MASKALIRNFHELLGISCNVHYFLSQFCYIIFSNILEKFSVMNLQIFYLFGHILQFLPNSVY